MNDAFHHCTLPQLSAVVIINSYTCYYCTFFNDDVSVMRQPHKRIYAQNIMLRYNNNKYNRNLWTVKAELEFVILIFQIQFIRRYSIVAMNYFAFPLLLYLIWLYSFYSVVWYLYFVFGVFQPFSKIFQQSNKNGI